MFYHDHKSRLLQIFITDAVIALEDVPLVEFMYLVFTHMPDELP